MYYFVNKFTCHSHEPKSPVFLYQTIKNANFKSLVLQNRTIALTINCFLQKLTIKSNTLSREVEQHSGPRNKLIFKTSNAWRGCCDRGMLKLQIDWYTFMYHTQPMRCDQILSILTEWAYILIHSSLHITQNIHLSSSDIMNILKTVLPTTHTPTHAHTHTHTHTHTRTRTHTHITYKCIFNRKSAFWFFRFTVYIFNTCVCVRVCVCVCVCICNISGEVRPFNFIDRHFHTYSFAPTWLFTRICQLFIWLEITRYNLG